MQEFWCIKTKIMKKKILTTTAIFITGFFTGIFFTDCIAQTVKDNSIAITEGKTTYSTPEVYELMQVAIALTDTGMVTNNVKMYANNVETGTAYYKEVMLKFGAYKNHPLIQKLNKSFSKAAMNYVYQLQLAFNTSFKNSAVAKHKQMPLIRRIWIGLHSINRKELENFGTTTNFREFYTSHMPYYNLVLQQTKNNLNVDKIQTWLENEFPNRYDKYKIVISPLTAGFHFTQNFIYKGEKTNIIWIAAPTQFDTLAFTPQHIAALYTSGAFTEIDHNYINPVTNKYKKEVNEIMGGTNRKNWIDESGDAALYTSGYALFNEYMTHAVYLLYIKNAYSESDYKVAAATKIKSMVSKRKYYRFKEFYENLLQLYQNKASSKTITKLYPDIIDFCRKMNK
jgi:Domain of unknown function (DUF4932)